MLRTPACGESVRWLCLPSVSDVFLLLLTKGPWVQLLPPGQRTYSKLNLDILAALLHLLRLLHDLLQELIGQHVVLVFADLGRGQGV